MLCKEYISHQVPVLQKTDVVNEVLSMEISADIPFFAVEDKNRFSGIISQDDMQQLSGEKTIGELEDEFILAQVKETDHILTALKLMQSLKTEVIAVTNNLNEFAGEITQSSIIDALSKYLSVNEGRFGLIVLEMQPLQYAVSEIAKIIQSNDAEIMQLNTYPDHETGSLVVSVMVNKIEIAAIVATFQRYEYNIRYYFGEESYDNELQSNYELLMRYINL